MASSDHGKVEKRGQSHVMRPDHSRHEDDFLEKWGKKSGLNDKTIITLHEHELTCEDVIIKLTDTQIERLRLAMGQEIRLQEAVTRLITAGKGRMFLSFKTCAPTKQGIL